MLVTLQASGMQKQSLNAVRLGVVIYGLNPSGSVLDLHIGSVLLLSLETALVHVKTLPDSRLVGYGQPIRGHTAMRSLERVR